MCIIAAKGQGFTLDDETITNCWEGNPDGGGFMYAKDEQLIIVKGLMTLDDFKRAYQVVGELPAVLHFRIKTHGAKDESNTHPFRISDRLAFAHNGIINDIHCDEKDKSDTWHFNEKILKPMCKHDGKFLARSFNKELIKGFIGWSKLAFMDHRGTISFINEDKGEWHDGVWFSNTSYKTKRVKKENTSVTTFKGKHYYHQRELSYSSLFAEGDMVEVVSLPGARSAAVIGDIGIVDAIYNNGWMKVAFHHPQGDGSIIEVLSVLHEDNVVYRSLQGVGHA